MLYGLVEADPVGARMGPVVLTHPRACLQPRKA